MLFPSESPTWLERSTEQFQSRSELSAAYFQGVSQSGNLDICEGSLFIHSAGHRGSFYLQMREQHIREKSPQGMSYRFHQEDNAGTIFIWQISSVNERCMANAL